METGKKRKILNGIMVLLIGVVIVSAVAVVGSLKGWFQREEDALLVSDRISGVVNIERNGIGYSLEKNVSLTGEDLVEVKKGSLAGIRVGDGGTFSLNENTRMKIQTCGPEEIKTNITQGEIFADVSSVKDKFTLLFGENQAEGTGAVFGAGVQPGSAFLCVFDGDVQVTAEDGTQEHVEAGEYLSISENSSGTVLSLDELHTSSLNEFQILQAKECGSRDRLFVSAAALQKVLDDREAEKQEALAAGLSGKVIPMGENGGESDGDIAESPGEDDGMGSLEESFDVTGEETIPEEPVQTQERPDVLQCTITILCDTILDHMEELSPGKEIYVPANGCILASSTVEFTEGETVFDVLSRVCAYADIQLEYSWTPVYSSYYVEGINHLYEFDCGNESGWMFKVNGWFPNYGCSSYYLEDGDNIVWQYSCEGLGADIGGTVY